MSEWRSDPQILRWDFLENLANNQLSKVIGLVPIVGYIILFNDKIVDLATFNQFVGANSAEETALWFSGLTRLRLIFFGSLLIFAANIIFKLCSPRVLTASKDDLTFSNRALESYALFEIAEIEAQVNSKDWHLRTPLLVEDERNASHFRADRTLAGRYREKRFLLRDYNEFVRAYLREWWFGQMHEKAVARYFTLALSTLGFAFLTLPTIDITQAVIVNLF